MIKNSRKNEFKKIWREQEKQKLIASIPMSHKDLNDLFNFLDEETSPCDRTLAKTIQFLRERNLDEKIVIHWLHEYGGFCDCEVIANVGDKFEEIVRHE